ncbi:hypothetical protein SAMN05443551_2994 [Marivita hallyeonensis]|uniref:Uncharacterized protein n=1 Tax=Marivita hallyeonensis TaxID=996342 RepID=A0A1M5VPK0_9RHOB|nr:hypothetical protein SAMN05443551_2994 [Marivita hallyeonensis]
MVSHWLRQSDGRAFAVQTHAQGALPPLGLWPIHPRGIFETEKLMGSVR